MNCDTWLPVVGSICNVVQVALEVLMLPATFKSLVSMTAPVAPSYLVIVNWMPVRRFEEEPVHKTTVDSRINEFTFSSDYRIDWSSKRVPKPDAGPY